MNDNEKPADLHGKEKKLNRNGTRRLLKAAAASVLAAVLAASPAVGSEGNLKDRIETLSRLEDRIEALKIAEVPETEPEKEVSRIIFYGDSRVVGMGMSCSGNAYVGEVSMGYDWMTGSGLSGLYGEMGADPNADVVFCFGVNDVGNVDAYAAWFNSFAEQNPDRRMWFMSVNPIDDGAAAANGYFARNGMVTDFNARLSAAVGDRYLDVYSVLVSNGFYAPDGVHYDGSTYSAIQDAAKSLIEEKI